MSESESKSGTDPSVDRVVLLLCPCCGHRAELESVSDDYGKMHQIKCTGCGLSLMTSISAEVIANAWNARRTDGLERWIDAEIDKLGTDVRSYHRERALHECHVQLKKLLNGLGL